MTQPAIFLDRDGVLIRDVGLLTRKDQVELLHGTTESVSRLRRAGFKLIVVTNQTVVARGMATEDDVRSIHASIQELLIRQGTKGIDAFYYCPHHPNATLPEYRLDCECRKPRMGMIMKAADEWKLDIPSSFTIGDRMSDIAAGRSAGCRTILLETGRHLEPPIESPEKIDAMCQPDFICDDLPDAVDTILSELS